MSLASLGIDYGVLNAMNLWVACLQPASDGRMQMVDYVFHEDRPDLAEVKVISSEASRQVPREASDLMMPWCNYSRMMSLWLWHGWMEGSTLCASTLPAQPVVRIALEGPPAQFVHPLLSTQAGELDVAFVSASGRELTLVRFLPAKEGRAASGSILWQMPLPGLVLAGRAALGPASTGSIRKLVLVEQQKEGVALHLLDFSGGARPAGIVTARIPGVVAVPGSQPGLRVEENGTAHAALIVASAPGALDLSVADVVFPVVDSGAPRVAVAAARKFAVPPVAAGIAYQARPDRPMRRDWVVVLADGCVASSQSDSPPMRPGGKPVTPLNLVALSQATYMLTLGLAGPTLEAVR